MKDAVDGLEKIIHTEPHQTHSISIVNAHTLNLATDEQAYRSVLNDSSIVFGDGTGVRWSARLRGAVMKDNLVGTDLIPEFLQATANRGYRYFLLGGDADIINQAANRAINRFPGWELVGYHHGYLTEEGTQEIIEKINALRPHLLLVGMGNPKQEQWIHANRHKLKVPLAIGVGGLFHHWAGDLKRAPLWVRKGGFEWLQILLQQPHKWRRYLLGNPKFILRVILTPN